MRFSLVVLCCCTSSALKGSYLDDDDDTVTTDAYVVDIHADREDQENQLLSLRLSDGTNLVFVHIPKNAGTTIENTVNSSGTLWGKHADNVLREFLGPQAPACSSWHVPPSFFTADSPYTSQDDVVFAVTRDPWDRTLSEFQYQNWNGMANVPCTMDGFNGWLQHRLSLDRYTADCHFLPQWDYIEGPDGHRYVLDENLIPIVELGTKLSTLLEQYHVHMHLGTRAMDSTACENLEQIPKAQLYNETSKAMMRDRFAKDFTHLGDKLV